MPSSLTMLLPPALGSSPHPPVSVYGTGPHSAIVAFLDGRPGSFATLLRSASRFGLCAFFLPRAPRACAGLLIPGSASASRVPTLLAVRGTGISTCCPSATRSRLALGPDSPRADQLYPGNLGYSAWGIHTPISLLIPAFSLPVPPRLFSVTLRRDGNAPLPTFRFPGLGVVFQPRTFSARGLSTSELLRTL